MDRVADVDALGLDETLFNRTGPRQTQQWCEQAGRSMCACAAYVRVAITLLKDIVPGQGGSGVLAELGAKCASELETGDPG